MATLSDELRARRCVRCGHPSDWHRHDDEACLQEHPQPCTPDVAPFRCLGYDCEAGGPPRCRCDCPTWIAPMSSPAQPREAPDAD